MKPKKFFSWKDLYDLESTLISASWQKNYKQYGNSWTLLYVIIWAKYLFNLLKPFTIPKHHTHARVSGQL